MSTNYQTDLHHARLLAQRALLDAGQAPAKPNRPGKRETKERLFKQVNRRVQR